MPPTRFSSIVLLLRRTFRRLEAPFGVCEFQFLFPGRRRALGRTRALDQFGKTVATFLNFFKRNQRQLAGLRVVEYVTVAIESSAQHAIKNKISRG